MTDAMARTKIVGYPLLSTHELRGDFRYSDRFQLLPAPPGTPRPPQIIGHYGLVIQLAIDPRVYPEREQDYWAHDIRERRRMEELKRKAPGKGKQSWWETEENIRKMNRNAAIVHELARLLSVVTNYKFFLAGNEQTWFLPIKAKHVPRDRFIPVWGQRCNPTLPHPTGREFTQAGPVTARLVNHAKYYEEIPGYGLGDPVIDFPDNLRVNGIVTSLEGLKRERPLGESTPVEIELDQDLVRTLRSLGYIGSPGWQKRAD